MFYTLDLGNVEQAPECFGIENFAIGCKSRTEFERQDLRIIAANGLVGARLLSSGLPMQPSRLEQNWSASEVRYSIHFLSIEMHRDSRLVLDEGSGNELHVAPQGFARPAEHVLFFRGTQKIHVAGVHIYCI